MKSAAQTSHKLSVVGGKRPDTQAVLVLGMHRSGTSALTRLVNLLGADLPCNLIPPIPDNNELGFWESRSIMAIHDEILASIGSSWDDCTAFPRSWFDSAAAQRFQERMLDVLRTDFSDSRLFVIKDPRMCRLVPFWRRVLQEFGAAPHFLIPIRDPLEIAASLKARDGFVPAKSLLLWLRHFLEVEQETRDAPRSFTLYSDLLRDWHSVAEKISSDLGIAWPRGVHRSQVEIDRFLSDAARHHHFTPDEMYRRSDIADCVKRVYRAALSINEVNSSALAVFDEVRRELNDADLTFGPLLQEAKLTQSQSSKRIAALDRDVAQARAAATTQQREIKRFEAEITDRDALVNRLRAEVDRQISAVAAANGNVNELTAKLDASEAAAASQQEQIAKLSSDLAAREQTLVQLQTERVHLNRVLQDLEAQIASHRAALDRQTAELASLTKHLHSSQKHVADLRAAVDELRASRSWRLTKPLRWALDRITRGGDRTT